MPAFDVAFELDVLARCARDPAYRRQARRVLDEHTFSDPVHAWAWSLMVELGPQDRMTGGLAVAAARKAFAEGKEEERDEHLRAVRRILKHEPEAPIAALRELEDFRGFHTLNAAMDQAIKLLDRGDVKAAREKLRTATKSRDALSYEFTDWWEDWDARQERRRYLREHPEERLQIATRFLPTFDRALKGGIGMELGILVGTTSRGKSMLAANLAFTAAAQGFRTLYISTEMEHELTATRVDARFLGIPYDDLKFGEVTEEDLEAAAQKRRRFGQRLAKRLRVASMPIRACTCEVVEQIMDDMAEEEEGPVQVVAFDSLDHMTPSERTGNRRDRETASYVDGKSIVEERRCAMWATTHAPKDVVNKIATAENVGESYDKARLADIVITINETKAGALKGRQKYYLAKHRQGKSKMLIEVEVDKARSTIREAPPEEKKAEGDADEEEAA